MGQDLARRRTNALKYVSRPLPLPVVDAGQLDRGGRYVQCAEHGGGPARETPRPRQWWGELSECPSGEQHGVNGGSLWSVPPTTHTRGSKDPIRFVLTCTLRVTH
jgi:hypothetical protein